MSEVSIQHKTYFTKTELKQRGWTDSLRQELLGEPDKIHTTAAGHDAHLYLVVNVLAAEENELWKNHQIGLELDRQVKLARANIQLIEVWRPLRNLRPFLSLATSKHYLKHFYQVDDLVKYLVNADATYEHEYLRSKVNERLAVIAIRGEYNESN